MTTLQEYLGQLAISTSTNDFTVGATAAALTTGSYFLRGYSGETQLIEHMQAQIQAIGAYAHSTVTYSATTGLITITLLDVTDTPVVAAITWNDAQLGLDLGFTGTQSGASSYTATYSPRYVWRPSRPLSDYPGDLATWWAPRSSTRTSRGRSGYTTATEGEIIYDGGGDGFGYGLIDIDETIITGTSTGWNQLERFWSDVAHKGQPIRCLPDRTSYTSASFRLALWAGLGSDGLGSWSDFRSRYRPEYNGLWDVKFRLWKYVTS